MMKIKFKIAAAVLIILLFALLNFAPVRGEIRNIFYLISNPAQKWLWQRGASVSILFQALSDNKVLIKENEDQKKKIQELLTENEALKEVKKENESLRTALNLGLEKEFNLEMADIIGKEISKDSVVIDRGLGDGLTVGMPLITVQKVLVGKIEKVYQNYSSIQLLTAEESSFAVQISGEDIYGLAKGKGALGLTVERIPREKEIKIGDQIFTSVLAGDFPRGLLVGEISEIKKSDVESFQKGEVKVSFDIGQLDTVFIIKDFKK